MADMRTMLRDYVLWNAEVMARVAALWELLDDVPGLEKALVRAMWI